jgi:hypothetical protein
MWSDDGATGDDPRVSDEEVPECADTIQKVSEFRMLVSWYWRLVLEQTAYCLEIRADRVGFGVVATENVRFEHMREILPGFLEVVPDWLHRELVKGDYTSLFACWSRRYILFGPLCLLNHDSSQDVSYGTVNHRIDLLECARGSALLRNTMGEHVVLRLKALPKNAAERVGLTRVFGRGREVLVDYGSSSPKGSPDRGVEVKSIVATSVGPCQVDDDDDDDDDDGGACESGDWHGFPRALGDDDEDFESLKFDFVGAMAEWRL